MLSEHPAETAIREAGATRAAVWREATGGGTARDYLQWLAGQWILFDLHMASRLVLRFNQSYRENQTQWRDAFDDWMLARFCDRIKGVTE